MKKVFIFAAVLAAIFAGIVSWLLFTPSGAQWVIRQAARQTFFAGKVVWAGFHGSLYGGLRVEHLEVRDMPYLPAGSLLRIQSAALRASGFSVNGFSGELVNARLFLPGADPVVINVKLLGEAVSGGLYARSLDLGAVRHVLAQFLDMPLFKGSLRDIDLVIGGHWDGLDVSGSFWVERIIQNEFVLQEAFARADLHFLKRRLHWETHGKLFLDKGWLRNALVRLELEPGYLYFSGRPSAPELNVHAVARVARTRIFVQVTGTRDAPKLELTSEPPYPQEQLLLMLTTGKRWIGVERSSGKSGMTPGLASNFVDYLLFGGERGAIIRMLGLSDISLNADDKKQGITFSKDVTGRLGVGYGVEIKTEPGRQKEWTQRLEGEYRLTDKFLLGVQKEVKPERVSGALGDQKDASSGGRLTPDDLPDDRVFLKYRSSF